MGIPTTMHYAELPPHMRDEMRDYIERGVIPGDFLRLILSNDFIAAHRKADSINQFALHNYAVFLSAHAPRGCYGTPHKVAAWSTHNGLAGRPIEGAVV